MDIFPDTILSIDERIDRWLRSCKGRTDSDRTPQIYLTIIKRFCYDIQRVGLDLDSPAHLIVEAAEIWLNTPWAKDHKSVSAATFNQRRAAISSFYLYSIRQGWRDNNPMVRIDRHKAMSIHAPTLDDNLVQHRLMAIDRTTRKGIRDYAIITVAAFTGKRASELLSMNIGCVSVESGGIRIQWPRLKEGKTQEEVLAFPHATPLLRHLHTQYGDTWQAYPATTPLWTSLANYKNGEPLTYNGLTSIYKDRLGVTKIHATRRYFANVLIRLGAPAPEVQRRMGHTTIGATQPYFDSVDTERNPRADGMARLMGLPQAGEGN